MSMEGSSRRKKGENEKNKIVEFQLANLASLGSPASNQSSGWYAEAVRSGRDKKIGKN